MITLDQNGDKRAVNHSCNILLFILLEHFQAFFFNKPSSGNVSTQKQRL